MFTKLYLCAYVIMDLEIINMVITVCIVDLTHPHKI